MDLNLKQEEIRYIKAVYRNTLVKEETAEVVVPDSLPDIMRIIDADAVALLRSKEADGGRVTITGIVNVSVIYIPDGVAGIRKMEANLPFSVTAENAGITQESLIVAKAEVISADARALNPRKIMTRVNLSVGILCGSQSELQINTEVSGKEDCGIEVQNGRCEMDLAQEICEKTFILSDEYKLPSAKPVISEILKTSVKLKAEDAKVVGSKIIVKGSADSVIYYRSDAGELESAEFSTSFSQVIESGIEEDAVSDVTLMLTGVYVNTELNSADEERNIMLELHAVAQCMTYCRRSAEYICDAYSTKYALEAEYAQEEIESYGGTELVTELVRGSMETPSMVRNIIGVNVTTGEVTSERTDTETIMRCDVNASVIFTAEDGRVLTSTKRFTAEGAIQDTDSVLYADASCGSEIYTAMSGDGIELRLPVIFCARRFEKEKITNITKLACDEENPLDLTGRPSVVLKRVESGDTLWKLAKRYNSKPEYIRQANDIEDDKNLQIGQLLIIPKKR